MWPGLKNLFISSLLGFMAMASAQTPDYPMKPIRILVGQGAGGGIDTLAMVAAVAKLDPHTLAKPALAITEDMASPPFR